ncbi:MAG: phosphonate ABC transporter, permease protein PhnE [Armatimonadota bacterium]|nr:phosphonate ABC transporter, permease protein PhnE [Armatimonadota bacterium]MDR7422486.1 phosphonate ABC transporter, permease protein PhnE [Armatimonadota bacterium]MDR7453440.1 phosphonate ABC transporter, permease protein PhnE [Armatimonadota bacterium]MDR7457350.1 phosphonate ABC transporter, permease protein PhnE [Armatimonadota bacterium]MDR7495648.1 phosphonate ABC transporter, permease protein PhnE [Armatimonadota bacterium]
MQRHDATSGLPRAPELPRPGLGSLRVLAWILVLGLIYAYGWRVTEINLVELATKWSLARPLLVDLLRPDLVARVPRIQLADAGVGLEGTPPPAPEVRRPAGQVTVTPANAAIGQPVTVSGSGFAPNRPVELIWKDQAGSEAAVGRLTTDAQGAFQTTLRVPDVIGTSNHVIARVTLEGTVLAPSNALRLTFFRMIETVFLALMGTTMAVVFAVPLSFLAAKNLMSRSALSLGVYFVMRTVFNIARSIEPLIMATVFAVWVGIGPFAGVLALGVHSIASLAKLYSEQIESIDPGPIEAITATGASMLQVVRYAVVPQIVPPFIAFTIYRWDINVRMSTVIGFVGGGGLGFLLIQYINLLQWRQAATAVWAITLVVAAMDYLSARVREKVV